MPKSTKCLAELPSALSAYLIATVAPGLADRDSPTRFRRASR